MLTRAHYPFDDSEESDTIIRTVDNVDFYIHRVILSVASVKLKEQLSKLPKPSSDDVSKPVFNVPETSKTIDLLLRFCYPVDDPFISAPMALGNVLEAALKYDIKWQ
ncbi:hypothetical protein BDQ17DRAFT_1313158 [Cyathus striatus]|nr:hypothetical protein BDQ17DRAFT_1313158 [Cyathus striatus]